MVRIDWAEVCEMAFLDDSGRLCMIGLMTRFPAPALPIAIRQVMLVARIADLQEQESFRIAISLVTPCGVSLSPRHKDDLDITVTTEYIFITLRDVPLAEEGMHHFAISVGTGDPVSIAVPVRLTTNRAQPSLKRGDEGAYFFGQSSWISRREVN
jgi:hypothetical protein